MLTVLKEIGGSLFEELKSERGQAETGELPTGAAGDKTHHIDRRAEEIILNGLEASGEPLTVISEEAGIVELNGGGRRVLVDPVDGSRNAVAGIPFYCTSIAVADGPRLGEVGLAYVINLANGDEFWAAKGGGAFLNGSAIATQQDDILRLVAYEAHTPGRDVPEVMPLLSQSRKARCFGATALDLAYLASGAVSVMVIPSLSRSFDFAGGWLLVKEAGGVFTNIEGNELEEVELGLKHISTVLASGNVELHKKAVKLFGRSD
jgi:myo-inositol-1(or 4)-monophosphatase